MPLPPPELVEALRDRYVFERELGRGGMATVYLARDLRHERAVALKLLHPQLALSLGSERFLREIRLAAQLQHPHLLPVHDSGEVTVGHGPRLLWFTMPYVEGASLRDRLRRERQLPMEEALRIAHEAARALDYAHRHEIIHRDIKPENILLTEDGDTLLADFGIGRAVGTAEGDDRLTDTGIVVGTPAYMSPEQAAGERELDARSDIYSLGCVLYEMLAGEPPFTGPTAQAIVARRLTEAPRSLSTMRERLPPAVDTLVADALARTPADRFPTAAAMADALERARRGNRTGEPVATTHPRSRARWIPAAAALAAAVAIAVALFRPKDASPLALNASLVAVAPFDVLDPSLALWREGLVDLLSRNLDGAGPLRTVPPTTIIRRWKGRADPESAAQLGRTTGAGLALYGSVLGAGRDSVRLRATLFDVSRGRPVDEWETRDQAARVDRAADSLTLRVIETLGRTRAVGAAKRALFGSTNLPALKAFLQGEQFFRQTDWDSAYVYYDRAIALDSGFAPALRRQSAVLGWSRTGYDSLSTMYALAAGAHNHGLPPRDSLLILGDSLMASLLEAGPLAYDADSAWGSRLRRLFATAEQVTDRYPDDPEAWFLLGEATEHLGPFASRPAGEVLAAFDRAIALDSAFAPSYIHPVEAAAASGPEAVRRYLRPYLALDPKVHEAEGDRLVQALLTPGTTTADIARLASPVSLDGLFEAHLVLATLPDSAERIIGLMRAIRSRTPAGSTPFRRRLIMEMALASTLMLRGRLAEASPIITAMDTTWPFADAALLGAVPPAIANAAFQRRLAGPVSQRLIEGLPWWAGRRDSSSIIRVAARADSAARHSANATTRVRARYAARAAAAYLALARGDTTDALARLDALDPNGCPGCHLDRLTRAELLAARGRDQEAWAIVRADDASFTLSPFPTSVLWVLLRGRVAERLGDRETAVRSYGWVADMWQHADPTLGPYVSEAREGLERLAREPQ